MNLDPKRILVAGLILVASCSKSSSSDDATDDTAASSSKTSSEAENTNVLAAAFPDQLALNVFPTTGASLRLTTASEDIQDKSQEELLKENENALKGEADSCLDRELFAKAGKDAEETCYEIDSDMSPAEFADKPGKSWGTVDGKNSDGEACLVSYTREAANKSILLVNKALAIVRGMICQAKKADANVKMPAAGEELDLKDAMKEAAGSKMAVATATINAVDGGTDAEPIYHSAVKMKDPRGNDMEVFLTNQKTTDGEIGTLAFRRPGKVDRFGDRGPDNNNTDNKYELLSIAYEFSGTGDSKNAKVELRRASMLKTFESFNSDGEVNLEGVPQDAENDKIHAINYVRFDMNPDTSAGRFSYWTNPGGRYDESARGFLYNVTEKDGKLSGCGVSGSDKNVSIRAAMKDSKLKLEPTGWWHPRWAQNTSTNKDTRFNAPEGSKVSKQCFTQNSAGLYEVTTDDARGYEMLGTDATGIKPPRPVAGNMPPPPKEVVK